MGLNVAVNSASELGVPVKVNSKLPPEIFGVTAVMVPPDVIIAVLDVIEIDEPLAATEDKVIIPLVFKADVLTTIPSKASFTAFASHAALASAVATLDFIVLMAEIALAEDVTADELKAVFPDMIL